MGQRFLMYDHEATIARDRPRAAFDEALSGGDETLDPRGRRLAERRDADAFRNLVANRKGKCAWIARCAWRARYVLLQYYDADRPPVAGLPLACFINHPTILGRRQGTHAPI